MTFDEVVEEVEVIVQDSSPTLIAKIPGYVNEALFEVAEEASPPELRRMGVVSTVVGQAWVNLPRGFDGKLLLVTNETGEIPINPSGLEGLMARSPGLTDVGEVDEVAQEGSILYYQGIPGTPQTLPILYRVTPSQLESGDDIPRWIPFHLQRPLLAHMAASIFFDKKEDGADGEKVNTAAQLSQYRRALGKFEEYVAKRRRSSMRSIWSI